MSTINHTEIKPEFKNGKWTAVFEFWHEDNPTARMRVVATGKTEKEALYKAFQFVKGDGAKS